MAAPFFSHLAEAAVLMRCSILVYGIFGLGFLITFPRDAGASAPSFFFVATNGNDAWSGTKFEPDPGKADGPFATLPRALRVAQEARQKPGADKSKATTVFVRGGVHFLREPLRITPDDSDVRLTAYFDEKPVLSGGRRISGWQEVTVQERKLLAASVPEARAGRWMFRELWVNGRRATRARHPNKGYLGIAELPDKPAQWTEGHMRFRVGEGDVKGGPGITNAEVVVMSKWVESRLPVAAFDEGQRLLSFSKRSVFELTKGDLYYLEGALEMLDQPGEWCLDPATGKVYYMPLPGEQSAQLEAIAPVLTQVVRIEGKPDQAQFVERVRFKGLTFSHTEWNFPVINQAGPNAARVSPGATPEVGGFSQAAIGVSAAVWGEGLRDCTFVSCAFANLGNYALELGRGCQSNQVVWCDLGNLGAGGIKLGETAFRDNVAEQTRANEISNCEIHDGGKMFHSAIGVWLGQSPDNRILNNTIHDFYYTGISIGWTWGYGRAFASNNLVAFNHIHHIGVKSDGDGPILSDMGGIYTLGKQPGTRIINNLWHDIAASRYGGWGIYFDEGSSGILAESNVVYRTTHGGFHQHYGETNMVWNNVFAFARDHQLQRSRVEPHLSFSFETNIVYFDSGALLGSEWKDDHFQMDYNVFFDARTDAEPESMRFGKATLEEWRSRGHDTHSVISDPLFVAPQKNDFSLKPDSPALKLGFRPIDVSKVGPRQDLSAQFERNPP
jgi:hypothetical protein